MIRSLHVPWRPSAALSPYVRAMTAYDLLLDRPGTHRGLPSTSLTFVLPVEQPLTVEWCGHPGTRSRAWSSVSGLHTRPAEIRHDGRLAGIQLALTPRGARALFGVPAAELAGVLTELGPVADEVGLSRRHLGALFLAEYGVTPKEYQRVARFTASSRELSRQVRHGRGSHRPSLAHLAAACGYADQAHLTREWTALAGCSPTTWLRDEFPFLQDDTVDAAIA